MERTTKKRVDKKLHEGAIWWRKTGGGSFTAKINGRVKIIKPNDLFAATEDEIPPGFRDVVIPADPEVRKALEEKPSTVIPQKMEYYVNHRGGGYYDVVDRGGNKQNQKALRKEEAEELLKNLVG
jgi:hypothetical protein